MEKTHAILILGLCLMMTACSVDNTGLISNPSMPDRQVIFQDDFSDINSGWLTLREENRIIDYENEGFRIWVNQPGFDYWSIPGLNFSDVILEVDASKAGGPDDNDYGLICRYVNQDTFYGFIISSDGYFGITKRNQGDHFVINSATMEFSEVIKGGDDVNRIRAECVGNRLTLLVNGVKLAEVVDDAYDTGDIGLIAGSFDTIGVDIYFDNFVMLKP